MWLQLEGRTAGLRRLAGSDDGRMYGTSDAGYQAKLGRLTGEEIEANEAATAAHRECTVKLFMDGTEARGGTSEQRSKRRSLATRCLAMLL